METNLEFTPAERLKIYKEILARLKSETEYTDYNGICVHLYNILKVLNVCFDDRVRIQHSLNLFFPELPIAIYSQYLFPLDKKGNQKRIKIIQKAIKEVEVTEKPFWSRFFSKLAFWK